MLKGNDQVHDKHCLEHQGFLMLPEAFCDEGLYGELSLACWWSIDRVCRAYQLRNRTSQELTILHDRSYSSSGKPSPFNEEAVNSNLFDKAKATPLPAEEAGEAAERLAAEPSTAGRHF